MKGAIQPNINHYKKMFSIRTFENLILDSYKTGLLRGTTHTYIGQEAIAVSALSYLSKDDIIVSNHRCHGHFLSYCEEYEGLLHEIMGTSKGICAGVGGSQHLQYGNFYSNGVLGGTVANAVGMALTEKKKKKGNIVVCFMGDGSLGEGIVYEVLNLASLWELPILFVVENNRYAQSTPIELNLAGSICGRFNAFGIESDEIETNDIGELLKKFYEAFYFVKNHNRPYCQVVHTYRMSPHSKGDDFRSPKEIEFWKTKDPLLVAKKYFSENEIFNIEKENVKKIKDLFVSAFKSVEKSKSEIFNVPLVQTSYQGINNNDSIYYKESKGKFVLNVLQDTFEDLMKNENVYFLGEDILDPYGGAFKVTKGLSKKFPDRVITCPISEAGMVGAANGMALRKLIPIVEIMFGDFLTLIIDQIINHATKFYGMYNGVECQLIIRTPMGGYRGYGPTHSQTLEKLLFGVSNLTIVACNTIHDQCLIWKRIISLKNPCLYIENKILYGQNVKLIKNEKIDSFFVSSINSYFPTTSLCLTENPPDVVLFTYGEQLETAILTSKKLFVEEEVIVKIVVPSQISPLPKEDLISCLGKCTMVVTLEEGIVDNGWGSYVISFLAGNITHKVNFRRCGALNSVIPTSVIGETEVLPNSEKLYELIIEMTNEI